MRERTIGLKHNWTIYVLRTGNYYAIWGKTVLCISVQVLIIDAFRKKYLNRYKIRENVISSISLI